MSASRDSAVTRETAEQVLAAIVRQFGEYVATGGSGPVLLPGSHENLPAGCWVICWEDGPFEWALRAFDGGLDEELSTLAGRRMDTPSEPCPDGVFCEPIYTFSLAVHPA